jgi:arylsulfatase A-like enzyme
MDLFPTFARVAGVSPPGNHSIDGMDMMPILKGEKGDPQRVLHWRFGNQWAVRKGDWKLIDGKTLYHLGDDPEESKDQAAEQPGIVRELRTLNQRWTRDVGHR